MNEDIKQISLQTEEASLQRENSQLRGEIRQLQLKLQILPDLHQEHVMQLQRKLSEGETHCFEIEKKLPNMCRNMSSTFQIPTPYRKMVEDINKTLERN